MSVDLCIHRCIHYVLPFVQDLGEQASFCRFLQIVSCQSRFCGTTRVSSFVLDDAVFVNIQIAWKCSFLKSSFSITIWCLVFKCKDFSNFKKSDLKWIHFSKFEGFEWKSEHFSKLISFEWKSIDVSGFYSFESKSRDFNEF